MTFGLGSSRPSTCLTLLLIRAPSHRFQQSPAASSRRSPGTETRTTQQDDGWERGRRPSWTRSSQLQILAGTVCCSRGGVAPQCSAGSVHHRGRTSRWSHKARPACPSSPPPHALTVQTWDARPNTLDTVPLASKIAKSDDDRRRDEEDEVCPYLGPHITRAPIRSRLPLSTTLPRRGNTDPAAVFRRRSTWARPRRSGGRERRLVARFDIADVSSKRPHSIFAGEPPVHPLVLIRRAGQEPCWLAAESPRT